MSRFKKGDIVRLRPEISADKQPYANRRGPWRVVGPGKDIGGHSLGYDHLQVETLDGELVIYNKTYHNTWGLNAAAEALELDTFLTACEGALDDKA